MSSGYDSLTLALEDWFDNPLSDLPDALRQRVEEVFVVRWDSLTIDHRRKRAADYDYTHGPATERERQIWFDFFCEKDGLEKESARVSALPAPLPSEEEAKNRLLAPLKQKLALMEQIYASNDTQRVEDYLNRADTQDGNKPTSKKANTNDVGFSGLLNIPSKVDDWFQVIDDMVKTFVEKHEIMPNKTQAWAQLCANPPRGHELSLGKDKGEECLIMPGTNPL